jgi:hypothetical protein
MWRKLVNRPKGIVDKGAHSVLALPLSYHITFLSVKPCLALSCLHVMAYRGQLANPGRYPVHSNDGELVAWVTVA